MAGATYPTLRDMADYGASLAFDDAETVMDLKRIDPDKRTLLLAGNRRGTVITVKERANNGDWVTRYVNVFSPRMFSAINLPDPTLGSRTIVIPLVRSDDKHKANADPGDWNSWPHDRRRLVDDLWAIGLIKLPILKAYNQKVDEHTELLGRNLEPWRPILAVALWLEEEHGMTGLFERMQKLSITYQNERADLETEDPARIAILVLLDMCEDSNGCEWLEFETAKLTEKMNDLAKRLEVNRQGQEEKPFINSVRVGLLLKSLRFMKADIREARRWRVSKRNVMDLVRAYGLVNDEQPVEAVAAVTSTGTAMNNEDETDDGLAGATGVTGYFMNNPSPEL